MKLSARNQLVGVVTSIERGAVNATVKVEVAGGAVITSSITNEAVDDLDLKIDDTVTALIKSTDVLIGK